MKKYSLLIIFILIVTSCREPIEYQFINSPKTIDCEGLDYDLAHDAYYSFRQDLAIYVKNLRIGYNYLNYQESLGYYIYRGALGNFDFNEIVTPHTKKLLVLLKKNEELWDTKSEKSSLNYKSEFVTCLVENIKNEESDLVFGIDETDYAAWVEGARKTFTDVFQSEDGELEEGEAPVAKRAKVDGS